MNLPRVLTVLTGIALLVAAIGCSAISPAPTPNIDATVEARVRATALANPTPDIDATVGVEDTKPLDDYTALVAPIGDELEKLYERMNDDFDEVFAGLVTALNSSSQAEWPEAFAEVQTFSDEMYNEWDTLLRRFVQITPPGELMEFHELYQEGFQLYHRAFFDFSTSIKIIVATGQMDDEMVTAISNDMLEADRKFTKAAAELAKVQARYK